MSDKKPKCQYLSCRKIKLKRSCIYCGRDMVYIKGNWYSQLYVKHCMDIVRNSDKLVALIDTVRSCALYKVKGGQDE